MSQNDLEKSFQKWSKTFSTETSDNLSTNNMLSISRIIKQIAELQHQMVLNKKFKASFRRLNYSPCT